MASFAIIMLGALLSGGALGAWLGSQAPIRTIPDEAPGWLACRTMDDQYNDDWAHSCDLDGGWM